MKKKKFRFSHLYLAVVMAITYLPLVMVVIFSFNDSKLTVSWKGFTLSWYQKLFQDAALIAALKNSLILGVVSCLVAAVIGTLGAIGMARVNYKSKGMMEYLSTVPIMVPEIILGMVFMAFFSFEPAVWYADSGFGAFRILYPLCIYDGKGKTGGNR